MHHLYFSYKSDHVYLSTWKCKQFLTYLGNTNSQVFFLFKAIQSKQHANTPVSLISLSDIWPRLQADWTFCGHSQVRLNMVAEYNLVIKLTKYIFLNSLLPLSAQGPHSLQSVSKPIQKMISKYIRIKYNLTINNNHIHVML